MVDACYIDDFNDPTKGLKEERYYLYGFKDDYGWIFITDGRKKVDFIQGEANAGKHLVVLSDGTVGLEEAAISPIVNLSVDPAVVIASTPTDVTVEVTVAKGNADIERVQLFEDGQLIKEWSDPDEVKDGGTYSIVRNINITNPIAYRAVTIDVKGMQGSADAMVSPKLKETTAYFGTRKTGLSPYTVTSRNFATTYTADYDSVIYKYVAEYGDLQDIIVDQVGGYLVKTFVKTTETIGGVLYNVYTQQNQAKVWDCPIEFV